jgi:CubicO group peptidase (beta-lactamase class C family)
MERERFLDAVRAVAVVRVMIWHAFGFAAITYFVSAVPAMFFVTGSLLARSLDRHGYMATLRDRTRRLLLPLWLFAAVAFGAMFVADQLTHSSVTRVPWRNLVWWIVPLSDPHGSLWEGGWMSSPLWYLRALLWLIIASPVLLWAIRRAPAPTLLTLATGVFALDIAARHPRWPLQTTTTPWIVGDFFLYSFFLCLGFLHRDGVLARINRGVWAVLAFVGATAGAAWVITQPVPDKVVNDSHPAHLFIGFAWLAGFMAIAPLIERLASASFARDTIRTINSRSLTIYLWHSTAIILGYHLLWNLTTPLPRGVFTASVVGLMFAGTAAFVAMFGWFEDVAGRRRLQLWPGALASNTRVREPQGRRIIAGAMAVSGAFGFFTVGATSVEALANRTNSTSTVLTASTATGTAESTTHSLRTPSQAPAPPSVDAVITPVLVTTTDDDASVASATKVSTDSTVDPTVAKLVATARAWLDQNGVSGVQFGISKGGTVDAVDAVNAVNATGTLGVDDTYDIWSVTKTLTTTLILREFEAGAIDLDAPLPQLSAVPSFPASQFTVRELLSHTSGLVNYRDTPTYLGAPNSITTPAEALTDAAAQPLLFTPGSKGSYSSTNYLVLGFLLEDITGMSFDQLVQESIAQPLGLSSLQITPPMPGEPNFSTGGITMDTADLLTWTTYYLRDHAGLSADTWTMMSTLDPASSLGTGLIGYCPCTVDASGAFQWKAVGYAGSTTLIQYSPRDDVAIVVNLSEPLWKSDAFFASILGLFESLRAVVDAGV